MQNSPEITSKKPAIEYEIHTNLPTLSNRGAGDFLKWLEQKNIPKNTENLLQGWATLIWSRMHYDALNYALMKEFPLDEKQWGWIDKLSISELSMHPEQVTLLLKTLWGYRKQFEKGSVLWTNIDLLCLALKKWNFQEFVSLLVETPTLQETILNDGNFAKSWMQIYEKKWIQEHMQMGIWNCKTLALMTKILLETADNRWNLWIKTIQIIEWDDSHVTLKIITKNWIIEFDPMQSLYRESSIR